MTQEIEIEYKNLLTKEEFHQLLHAFPFPKEGQKQINHYFETDSFSLKQKNAALRIREKNKAFQLTLKEPHSEGLLETHATLTEKESLSWMDGHIVNKDSVMDQLNKMKIPLDQLRYFGSLTTVRHEVKYQNVLLVLDKSFYNNHIDYEFELEAPSQKVGEAAFHDILSRCNIKVKDTPNKIQRFFTTI